MDRATYCQQVETRLRELQETLSRRAFPRPATVDTARELAALKERNEAVLKQIADVLARVAALRASPDPDWETKKADIDREVAEIETLRMSL